MRPGVFRLIITVIALSAGPWLWGCGSDDFLLEETGQRYQANITILDGDEAQLTIDTVQGSCDGEPEDFFDVFAEINIQIASDATGLTLDYYTLEYFPLQSPNGLGQLVGPPELVDPDIGYYDIDIPAGSASEFTITCMSVLTKHEYENKLADLQAADPASYGTLTHSRYTIRITLYFTDTADVDRTIQLERTVYLGPYDNC